ncbi:hypothetical protein HQ308_14720 [Rhodococcus sp. BP-241]|nr:hypothetical protein [Rhodococcus sp. BP-241]
MNGWTQTDADRFRQIPVPLLRSKLPHDGVAFGSAASATFTARSSFGFGTV